MRPLFARKGLNLDFPPDYGGFDAVFYWQWKLSISCCSTCIGLRFLRFFFFFFFCFLLFLEVLFFTVPISLIPFRLPDPGDGYWFPKMENPISCSLFPKGLDCEG